MRNFFHKFFGHSSRNFKPSAQRTFPFAVSSECVEVSCRHIDPDEEVPTPKGAIISYLDVEALKFWNGKKTDYIIPDYYQETAFGRNVIPARDRLLTQGFLEVGDLRTNIALRTVPDIKAVLAEKGLKTTGNKTELIQRLLDYVPEDEIEEMFPVGKYKITEAGVRAMKPYSIIQTNSDHALHFSYFRLLEEKSKTPEDPDNAILTRMFSHDLEECYRTKDVSTYLRLISDFGRFMQETGEPERALQCYILAYFVWLKDTETLNCSVTGPEGYYMAQNIEIAAKEAGYDLNMLMGTFQRIVVECRPFGISSKKDIQKAISAFKSALKITN